MSGVYWGIVFGLLTMIATLFVCVDILYSRPEGSTKMSPGTADESGKAVTQPSTGPRKAA